MASLLDLLGQTWPARMAKSAWEAAKLPGDVYAGRVDPMSEQGIGRATNLAGMVMGGTFATAPRGALGAGPGIRAYHGSPYDFERFDLKKIGTGEGAQAYGHGLYFAENPAVAKMYKENLAGNTVDIGGRFLEAEPAANLLAQRITEKYPNFETPTQAAGWVIRKINAGKTPAEISKDVSGMAWSEPQRDAVRAALADAGDWKPGGRMYEVNIRAEPRQFLDWDKALAGQSANVRAALEPYANIRGPQIDPQTWTTRHGGPITGGQFYESSRLVPGEYRDPVAASAALREAGIPGIRYLDQGSRMPAMRAQAEISRWEQALARADTPYEIQRTTEGLARAKEQAQGTSNYVLFRDDIIDIVRKYGWAGLAAFGISEEQAKEAGVDKPKTRIGNKSYEM